MAVFISLRVNRTKILNDINSQDLFSFTKNVIGYVLRSFQAEFLAAQTGYRF